KRQLIHLFVRDADEATGNSNVLFVTEVALAGCDKHGTTMPVIFTAAFLYDGTFAGDVRSGLGDYWYYQNPIHGSDTFEVQEIGDGCFQSSTSNEKKAAAYQSLVGAVITHRPLESVTDQESVKQLMLSLIGLEDEVLQFFSSDTLKIEEGEG
ncbi:MAG: hypothetical protein P1V97_26395, partial [Planctomycetota bacterium]|nr:hypothetical protein [Planctomycetota bacterium]